MQPKLFETEAKKPTKPINTCGQCQHIFEHQYNSSLKYCAKQDDVKTATYKKRVRSRQGSCILFEKK